MRQLVRALAHLTLLAAAWIVVMYLAMGVIVGAAVYLNCRDLDARRVREYPGALP